MFRVYAEHLNDLPLKMNPEAPGTTNGYWMPTVVIDEDVKFDRDVLLAQFKDSNIDGRVFFWPLTMLPMFEQKPENAISYNLYQRAVNLPSYFDLTEEEIIKVANLIRASVHSV